MGSSMSSELRHKILDILSLHKESVGVHTLINKLSREKGIDVDNILTELLIMKALGLIDIQAKEDDEEGIVLNVSLTYYGNLLIKYKV